MANIISRLKLESGEFDSKIKRAGQELLAYSEHCKKMGLQMGYANRDAKEFAKALGSMQTVSQTARGKINELSEAFVNAKVMYKNMTDEEKKGEFGKNLAKSLDQLKTRLNAAKQDLADVQKELNGGGGKFGDFGNVIDTLGSKLGVTGNLTEMLTSKTALLTGAVGASVAIIGKATEAWANYNAELAKQDQVTQVTTGLKGDDADRMTDKMRALSDTYKVEFRDAINAANTLMTQFGVTGDQATQLIKDGMQGMIQGDGPKLLQMIQQYAPAFRDAGISASQLVAIIHNSEGGIFTDQNMNAIVMGIKNIRLMTKATSDSLAQMGIDGEKMSKQMSDGTMTVFEALHKVATAIENAKAGSKEAGEVMQYVFGRQGVTAGTNLAKAIETLNTDLEQTKIQTGEVGDAMAELQQANEDLNQAIRDAFSYDGWDQMANGIKAKLITALATVIEQLGKIRQFFDSFSPGNVTNTSEVEKQLKKLRSAKTSGSTYYTNFAYNDQVEKYNRNINGLDAYIKQYDQNHSSVNTVIQKASKEYGQKFSSIEDLRDLRNAYRQSLEDYKKGALSILSEPTKTTNTSNTNPHRTGGNTTTTKTEDTNYAADSIMAQEKLVAKLTDQYKRAGAAVKDGIKKQLDEAKKTLDEMTGKDKKVELPKGSMAALTKELQDYQKAQQLAADGKEWREYQLKIDDVTRRIAILKGELPKGETATITVSVDESNADELKKTIEGIGDKDVKITTSVDDSALEDVSDEQRTVTFKADDRDVLSKVADIKGITIDPKTLEFRADNAEAMKAVDGMKNVTFDEKTLTVIPQTQEAAKELLKLNTFKLVDKQVAVTVSDDKAMKDLQAVAKVTIPEKEVKVKVTNPKAVDVKVNEVAGTQHQAPTLKPIEQTVNYKQGDVDIQDIPDEKTVRVDYEQGDMPDMPDDEQRTVTFTADDSDVLSKVADIKGITIDPKTLEFRADNAEAMKAVEGMKNVTFDKKTLTVIPQTLDAVKALAKLNGFALVDKQVAVTVNDDKAMKDLQAVAKVTIPDKEVKVKVSNPKAVDVKVNEVAGTQHQAPTLKPIEQTVNYKQGDVDLQDIPDEKTVRVDYEQGDMPDMPDDEQRTVTFTADDRDVLSKVADIKGITIDPKTLVFTANDSEALQAAAKIQGVTIDEKTMTVKAQTLEAAKQVEALNGIKLDTKTLAIKISTDDPEVLKTLQQKLDALGLSFKIDFKPKEPIDKNLFNEQNLNAKIADLKNKMSGITIGTQGWLDMQGLLADAQAFSNMLQVAIKNGMDVTALNLEDFWKKIFGGKDGTAIATEELQSMLDQINAYLQEHGVEPIKINFETGDVKTQAKNMSKDWSAAASAIQSVGSAMSQIEDPAAKVVGTVAQAIATVALGYATATTQAASMGPWAWIAFAATGLATMISTISAIHSATGYEDGGIIPGNNHNDGIIAKVSSGELILNRAQQGVLADALHDNNQQPEHSLQPYLDGELIYLGLQAYLRRAGMGEIVTANR